jgi:hypothetical protein
VLYVLKHPLTGRLPPFDSWMALVEYATEIAEKEALNRLSDNIDDLMCEIADEIIETAEEYGGKNVN